MIFNKKSDITLNSLGLKEDNFEIVSEYKYLGHIIQENLSDVKDVNFRLSSFYGKSNWVYRNFKRISSDALDFLFKLFCNPEYGLTIWNLGEITNKPCFKTFTVAYSNAIKKVLGVPFSMSSHAVAEIFNHLLFYHSVAFIQIRYFKRIFRSFNPILKILNIKNCYLYISVNKRVKDIYNSDIMLNDLDTLKSRVFWVQNHEPQTSRSVIIDN